MTGTTAYALSKKYVNSSLDGLGALKGSPCAIKSTTETDQGTVIVFEWTSASGTTEETTILVKNGEAGVAPAITAERNADDNGAVITIKNPDGTVADTVIINDGASGEATSIDWSKVENKPFVTLSSDSFKVDENGVLTIVESGEGNKINSVSVNGTEVTPDENKNVDITVPTISVETGNMIETKTDGIYVKDMSVKVSTEENNQIETKDDGIYVAPADLSEYSKTIETEDFIEEFVNEQLYNITTVEAHYEIADSTTENALEVVADGTATDGQIDISFVTPLLDGVAVNVGDYVVWVETTETEDEIYARKNNVYSKSEMDKKIAEIATGGEIELDNYVEHKELTYAEYQTLSEEEQKNGAIYFITDVDENGNITGYTAGTGVEISEDKVVSLNSSVITNPNLLDNPDFSINQRGQAEYSGYNTQNGYTVDRWLQYPGYSNVTPVSGGVILSYNAGDALPEGSYVRMTQIFEHPLVEGEPYTLQVKVDGNIFKATINPNSTYKSLVLDADKKYTAFVNTGGIIIQLNQGKQATFEWVKLEVGSVATTYIPPHPATELTKCKRYYQRIKTKRERMWMYATNQLTFFLEYPEMRTNPAATIVGTPTVTNLASGIQDGFTFTIGWCDLAGLRIDATKTAHGMTDAVLVINSSSGDYIELSADLQ